MGIQVGRVSIEQKEDSAGHVWIEGIQDADTDWRDARYDLDFRLHMERFILNTMAGSEAHRRFNPQGWRKSAGSDEKTIEKILKRFCRSDEEKRAYYKLLRLWTKHLVKDHWSEIKRVARGLLKNEDPAELLRNIRQDPYYFIGV